jgi:hypothetical protein
MKLLLENWREYLNESEYDRRNDYGRISGEQGHTRKKWRDFEKGTWELIKKFENEDDFKKKLQDLYDTTRLPSIYMHELLGNLLDKNEDTLPEEVYDAILDQSFEMKNQ